MPVNGNTNGVHVNGNGTKSEDSAFNPLTYPASRQPFSQTEFSSPSSQYRGAPFWSLNSKLDGEKLVRQVQTFEDMGTGGFHIHTRVGLDTPYMGPEFMNVVKDLVEEAKKKGLYAYLYDEDRWPSGFAGGAVIEGHPELKGRHILFTPFPYGACPYDFKPKAPNGNAYGQRSELGELLAIYDIVLDSEGFLTSSTPYAPNSPPSTTKGTLWYAYSEPNPGSEFFGGDGSDCYPDLLNPEVAQRFIETTHEVYKKHLGEHFGTTCPSIFTDEPQYAPFVALSTAHSKQDVFLPWTPDFPKSFTKLYSYDVIPLLPELVWQLPKDAPSRIRYDFHNHVAERFTSGYLDVISAWCKENGIKSTGHLNGEGTLITQTMSNGDPMRAYRSMEIPGIDMLCDEREYNTAKAAQSIVRQFGRTGMMSELYGVTGWTFDFKGHKGQGDWQAALGVTLRVHHLTYSSMLGEGKRDYPASIGYQSPWYKLYKSGVEDHFARVNTAMTRGKAVTKVAVIHPIESNWLVWGPGDMCGQALDAREQAFQELTKWLLFGTIDFDFLNESLLPEQVSMDSFKQGEPFRVGQCQYDVIIIPDLFTIRSTTLSRLQAFAACGGKVIIAGQAPQLIDALTPKSPLSIPGSQQVAWRKGSILSALEPHRDVGLMISSSTLYRSKGARSDSLMYQMREDGEERFLFICNVDRQEPAPVEVSLRGEWKVKVLDTLTGETYDLATTQTSGWTKFNWHFDGVESLLVQLSHGTSTAGRNQFVLREGFKEVASVNLLSVELSQPNVLLLDYVNYKMDNEPWSELTEVLSVDNALRRRFGFFVKGAKFKQPHTISQEERKPIGQLTLKFDFTSEVEVVGSKLAVEQPSDMSIKLDGKPISSTPVGWWIDEDIKTLELPTISKGTHTIEITTAYHVLSSLERIYILGDFGVQVNGRDTKIIPSQLDTLRFGDYTHQGLPFYAGNVIYNCEFSAPETEGKVALRCQHFSSPLVSATIDGGSTKLIPYQPHTLDLGVITPGTHKVSFTSYGNLQNAFGQLHLPPHKTDWLNADSFRTTPGDWWSDEYQLCTMGLLDCPRVMVEGKQELSHSRRGYHEHHF